METISRLVRSVTRSFYGVEHVLVMDFLTITPIYPLRNLAAHFHFSVDDTQDLCQDLEASGLLEIHQNDKGEMYCYLNRAQAVNAIRWKLLHISQQLKEQPDPEESKLLYLCPQCTRRWSQLDVIDEGGPEGFSCPRCAGLLANIICREDSKLWSDLVHFQNMLQEIEQVETRPISFADAYESEKNKKRVR